MNRKKGEPVETKTKIRKSYSNSGVERRAAENLPGLAVLWGAIGDVGLVTEMQEDSKEIEIGGTRQQKISSCLEELDGFMQRNIPVVSSLILAEKSAAVNLKPTNIVETVMNIMGITSMKNVGPHLPLAELGLDSMMTVEIRQTLESKFNVFLIPQDIRSLNFSRLQEMSAKQTEGGDKLGNKTNHRAENSDAFPEEGMSSLRGW